jgi:hypothetical protein
VASLSAIMSTGLAAVLIIEPIAEFLTNGSGWSVEAWCTRKECKGDGGGGERDDR